MLLMGYLIALALLFLFSLAWHDQPATEASYPDRTRTNKRREDPQPNQPLES
jgi:hypothetical protein